MLILSTQKKSSYEKSHPHAFRDSFDYPFTSTAIFPRTMCGVHVSGKFIEDLKLFKKEVDF